MKSPRSEQPGKAISVCLLVALGALVVLISFQKQHWDTDILWALRSGEWIVSHSRVPATDPFSYTFAGHPWVDFTWGFQVLAHLFYAYLGGWAGLFLLQVGLVSLTLAALFINLRLLTGRLWLAVAVLFLAFVGAHTRFFVRPHLFEFFFVTLYLLLFTLHEKRSNPIYLYLLVPAQVVWINMHSSAVLGTFIAFSYFGGQVIDEFRQGGYSFRLDLSSRARRYLLAAVAMPVASLVNPYGPRLLLFPFVHNSPGNADAIRHIGEWIRPQFKELFFYFYPFPLDHFAFIVLLVCTAAALALSFKRVKARDLMLLAAALYMGVSHVRWLGLFCFFAAPVLAANIAPVLAQRPGHLRALRWCAALLAVFLAAVMFRDYLGAAKAADRGLGLKHGSYPSGTVEFMKREHLAGNIYNEYVYGGYLIFYYPELKVFIDGRTPTVYSPYFFWKSRLVTDPGRWSRLTGEYSIDMALIKLRDPLCGKLHDNEGWKAVAFDDTSILYLKDTPRFRDVLSRYGISGLNACAEEIKDLPEDKGGLEAARAELVRMLKDGSVAGYARPHRLLGFVDSKLGLGEEAVAELGRAVGIAPDARTFYTLGTVYGKLNKKEEALGAFMASVDLDGDYKDGLLGAGVAYYDLQDYGNAVRYLKRYLKLADDSSEQIAYKTIAGAYFETGALEDATVNFRRAAFLTDDMAELADIYYSLGNTLFETGGFEEGAGYYALAIENKPDYAGALGKLAESHRAAGRTAKAAAIEALLEGRPPAPAPPGRKTGAR
ncbi:MAG: tetratricopeptide repeat protein [Thermodesulfobacteriota bacterium]